MLWNLVSCTLPFEIWSARFAEPRPVSKTLWKVHLEDCDTSLGSDLTKMKLESRWGVQISYRELLHQQGGESRACATCKRVEDKETLQPRALPVPGHPSDLDINNLPAPVIAVPPFPEIHPSNPSVFDVLFFFFTSLLLIRERLFGKVGTSHTFCPFGPPPCPRTVLPQASCISIRFLQTKVNCVKVWSWNAEIWFKKKMHFASTQKLPRGGMYWGIHPPRTERFPEDGNFAQRFLRNSSI